jgi:hypothetical protein
MPRKERKNKRRAAVNVTPIQERWLNGEWLLGSEPRTPHETMQALALMSGIGANALWEAHGNSETHFWKPGMNSPITCTPDLEHHEACWLESGEGDNDPYGGDSRFIFTYYTTDERKTLWAEFGDKDNFHWEPILRRPIPIGASVDSAIVQFAGNGLTPFNIV